MVGTKLISPRGSPPSASESASTVSTTLILFDKCAVKLEKKANFVANEDLKEKDEKDFIGYGNECNCFMCGRMWRKREKREQ
jgi:hypothetical protein